MKKVLICDPMDPDAFEDLKSIPGLDITLRTGMDEDELVDTAAVQNRAISVPTEPSPGTLARRISTVCPTH